MLFALRRYLHIILIFFILTACLSAYLIHYNNDVMRWEWLWKLTHAKTLKWKGAVVTYGDDMVYRISDNDKQCAFIPWNYNHKGALGIYSYQLTSEIDVFRKHKDNEHYSANSIEVSKEYNKVIYTKQTSKTEDEVVHSYHLIDKDIIISYAGPDKNYIYYKNKLLEYVKENVTQKLDN